MTPISKFIALSTKTKLKTDQVKAWFQTVIGNAPVGTPVAVMVMGPSGIHEPVILLHREAEKEHFYIVPLTRDLMDDEIEKIVIAFVERVPDIDFDICSPTSIGVVDPASAPLSVDQERYLMLCAAFAKRQHEQWLKDRTDNGWRYGTSVSLENKTHPLLRPWDELPSQFRKIDPELPQMLLDLLNEQGFAVITKEELDSLVSLSRSGFA